MSAYTIRATRDFGYYVMMLNTGSHEELPVCCAGTLDECLYWIKTEFLKEAQVKNTAADNSD